jgi:hypothetical protein
MAAADDLPDVILFGSTDHARLLNFLNVTSNFAVSSSVSGGLDISCTLSSGRS